MPLPPYDKCLHFILGTLIACITVPFLGIVLSMVTVTILAAYKEVWDHYHKPHTPELWDALATMFGGLPVWIAYGCALTLRPLI